MSTLNVSSDSFVTSRKFYDDKNYPRGLGRSGDYTLSEVNILQTHGVAFSELASGKRAPINDEEKKFVEVSAGNLLPETKMEKAWVKYQNKILSPKQFHTLFGRSKVDAEDGDVEDDEPLDLDD